MFVIFNHACNFKSHAARSPNFEFIHVITPWIVLHQIQLQIQCKHISLTLDPRPSAPWPE